jgi:hypothetical protein
MLEIGKQGGYSYGLETAGGTADVQKFIGDLSLRPPEHAMAAAVTAAPSLELTAPARRGHDPSALSAGAEVRASHGSDGDASHEPWSAFKQRPLAESAQPPVQQSAGGGGTPPPPHDSPPPAAGDVPDKPEPTPGNNAGSDNSAGQEPTTPASAPSSKWYDRAESAPPDISQGTWPDAAGDVSASVANFFNTPEASGSDAILDAVFSVPAHLPAQPSDTPRTAFVELIVTLPPSMVEQVTAAQDALPPPADRPRTSADLPLRTPGGELPKGVTPTDESFMLALDNPGLERIRTGLSNDAVAPGKDNPNVGVLDVFTLDDLTDEEVAIAGGVLRAVAQRFKSAMPNRYEAPQPGTLRYEFIEEDE